MSMGTHALTSPCQPAPSSPKSSLAALVPGFWLSSLPSLQGSRNFPCWPDARLPSPGLRESSSLSPASYALLRADAPRPAVVTQCPFLVPAASASLLLLLSQPQALPSSLRAPSFCTRMSTSWGQHHTGSPSLAWQTLRPKYKETAGLEAAGAEPGPRPSCHLPQAWPLEVPSSTCWRMWKT